MKSKIKCILAALCGILTAGLIALVRFVDVAPIGPEGTCIGLSHINQCVFRFFGVSMLLYNITDWLGLVAVATAFLFAVTGCLQLVKRRSLFKVDGAILCLGALYILVIGIYLLFEKVIVNYRPIIMPGCTRPEASFPSSHTMLVCVIMGSAMMLLDKYVKEKSINKVLWRACALIIGITVIGRLMSGVHWFTDIIGGLLISAAMLLVYSAVKDNLGG